MDAAGNRVVLTYGTFDLFHVGHLKILNRLSELGDRLIVGVSTDEFNKGKGKQTIIPYDDRAAIVAGLKVVDEVIPEESWDQKVRDIKAHNVDVFGMGHDWTGKFDDLEEYCEVVYLPRTEGVSSTEIKQILSVLDRTHINDLKKALDLISSIVDRFE
jgi:glycerol-3-phosphate cytidylyltransferase